MSKTERRKLFQPIPLSSILDPSHQTPFSKLEQFQFDLDLSNVHSHRPEVEQISLWRKLQTTLINAMSNLVVISQPVFATSMGKSTANSASTMSLIPWKPNKSSELSEVINLSDGSGSPLLSPSKQDSRQQQSLYHSVRSGLECLRYFATHPLHEEKATPVHSCKQNINSSYDFSYSDSSSRVSFEPNSGYLGSSAILFPAPFPFFVASEHQYYSSSWCPAAPQVPAPNLFSLAMSGFLLASPPYLNAFYENSCLFSPIHNIKGSPAAHKPSRTMNGVGSEFEIIIHATSHQSSQEPGKGLSSHTSASASAKNTSSMSEGGGGGGAGGCIRVANWRSNNNEDNCPFQSVSVCSSSSSKGGTVTFSCASATVTSSSPRTMAMACPRSANRRLKTESESSVDSFVEFSASVESTDSFCIVFESAGGCIDEEYLLEFDRDDDEWEDDDDEEEESEDEEDQIFDYAAETDGEIFQTEIDDGNELQGLAEHDQTDGASCSATCSKKRKSKKVSFDEENLVSVIEFEDDAESRRARETYWEVFARDRARFQDRIFRTGDILEPILLGAHRTKVFSCRFKEPQP
ncbi:hypothetical protein Ocin01_09503 [Orchesella cincta]|uniref:Uncharacterized protein n=1 Tax=Orchesella cincta TaxID=48709 RepID=A0A1D2MWJ5_ORCCI|nr:hypothetical protein Ocin01_09503 [Orchesella cincta]